MGVYLRLPSRVYDRTYAQASAAGVSVPEILRRALQRRGAQAEDDEE